MQLTVYQMWWAAFPPGLTCSTSAALLLTFSLCLSQEVQRGVSWSDEEQEAGPAEEKHMSQSSGHQQGPAEPQLCSQQPQCSQPGRAHPALSQLLRSVPFTHSVTMCPTSNYITEEGLWWEPNNHPLFCWAAELSRSLSSLLWFIILIPKNAGYLQRTMFLGLAFLRQQVLSKVHQNLMHNKTFTIRLA